MKRVTLVLLVTLWSLSGNAKVKIGIMDTGILPGAELELQLCKTGHYDFIQNTEGIPFGLHPHGTTMAKIIQAQLGSFDDYCFVIYRVLAGRHTNSIDPAKRALIRAQQDNIKVLNMSFNGGLGLKDMEDEAEEMRKFGKKGGVMFVAAGNEGEDLDKACKFAPACYTKIKNMIVVGALTTTGHQHPISNYGKRVHVWLPGITYIPGAGIIVGTSVATAVATGRYVRKKYAKK